MLAEIASQAARLARHADCLERAARDPQALSEPRVAARLLLMAGAARTAAALAGRSGTVPNTAEHAEAAVNR